MGAAAEGVGAPARARGRGRRRAVRAVAGVVAVAAVAGTAAWLLAPDDPQAPSAANDRIPLGSAAAQRRDLVDRQDVDGTLGFANRTTVAAPRAGTITRLRAAGTTVLRGQSLLSIDAQATAWVLYGRRPMYRDLGPGATDGGDVRQLERNLRALGYDPGTVDPDWTSATTAAVEAFQADRGLTETGTLKRTDVVISDGPARVGEHRLGVGGQARAGAPVTALTARAPVVTAAIPAERAGEVHAGDRVEVALPDGRTARGRVSAVGRVASAGTDQDPPTVELTVALAAADRRKARLDGAPVTVSLETGRTRDALAVPVTALVATAPGRYAVQLAGSGRVVGVRLGAFADGWVQVTGRGLQQGVRVVVPR